MDKLIGDNVARARGTMTQSDLAARMREEGHKWSQTTVWKVESGERPIRMAECFSLSWILEQPIAYFIRPRVNSEMDEKSATLLRRQVELVRAASEFRKAQDDLGRALGNWEDETKISGSLSELWRRVNLSIEDAISEDLSDESYGYYDLRRRDF